MRIFNGKEILITGGTGSFGNAFCDYIINSKTRVKRLVVFSRDEFKQSEMEKKYPVKKFPFIRFFLGDVRDSTRLHRAIENIDFVIHAAALKHVNLGEYNPMEVIKTNVIGAQNVIEACLDQKVKNVIALSTDKASSPINLYGASKLCSDKIFISANNIKGKRNIKFSIVRYGNVLGSRGSVLPIFLKSNKKNEPFKITDPKMTRFNITLEQGVDLVNWSFANNLGGEIFVPKLRSFNILDLSRAINYRAKFNFIGIRPGEKLHEELISESDSYNTLEGKNNYIILNNLNQTEIQKYCKLKKLKKVKEGFKYLSNTNNDFLKPTEIKKILLKNKFI
ncbi:UDP-N-acetylglucosamine 4,6-dehydratase (inverting) [Candidatus Pelagibacter sp.]|jgi:UDP-N-acetylglucosamine 4,6-dehydratase (inverting)|nr:UDP-N-acetylglucosamine 4,6-dehydratase (inverting) [Candidatus Pelagibacter sp.]